MNYFLIRLWCGTKSGFYMTTSDDQLSSWTEKKLQSTFQNQTCIKKRSWLLFGCLLPIWSTIAFWILAKSWHTSKKCAQQINEMHRKFQHLQLAFVSRKGPILLHDDAQPHITQPTLQKLNELGYVVCLIPPYSPDLLLTDYHFFKHLNNFLWRKHFHNQQEAENAFQEFAQSWSMDFTLSE